MWTVYILPTVLIFTIITPTNGARILALLLFPAKSHHVFFQSVLKVLALQGHQVVVYSPFPQESPVPNYIDVYMNISFIDNFDLEVIEEMLKASPVCEMKKWWKYSDSLSEKIFLNENIRKLTESDEKFDLVITETFSVQEAMLGFGYKFNAPTIAFHSVGSISIINRVMGNSLALSYIPDIGLPLTDTMTFFERVVNSYSILSTLVSFYYEHIPKQQAMMDRYMKLHNAPSLIDMIQNVSLVFTNAHPTISYSQPLTPNIIPLGGIHVSTKRKPLPQHIQKFMDSAKNGVIYLSLGSFIPDEVMPKQYFDNFVKVFKKLSQAVLWKTRAENISQLPDNVMIAKWVPQQDVLAHPNCILFMTHGGLLSQLETVHAGVPVIGIPFLGDQSRNVRFYEEKGVGIKLNFLELSEESITRSLTTVLGNPKYKENAQKLSRIYKDLAMSQENSAVFWVEYVLRHGGAQHLKPASARLSWYQLALLDVLLAITVLTVAALVTIYLICMKLSLCIRNTVKEKHSSKKKN